MANNIQWHKQMWFYYQTVPTLRNDTFKMHYELGLYALCHVYVPKYVISVIPSIMNTMKAEGIYNTISLPQDGE